MIPVVLVHSGFQDYLNYSINKALEKNTVYLIGDVDPNIKNDNFKFFEISSYMNSDFYEFQKLYKHMSTNPYNFELFCFLRWFILYDFMKKNSLETVFYIDSDVMLYVDVNQEWDKFNQFDFTLLHRTAAVSSFITKDGITNFTSALMKIYRNKESYEFKKIESHYLVRSQFNLGGGVCDMTLLDYYHYNDSIGGCPGKVGEMMIIINDSTYDHNILAKDQYFEFENGMKKVRMIDGEPFVYSEKMKKLIKFNSLHFNSGAKSLMKNYF
jgi:hypothetical protein